MRWNPEVRAAAVLLGVALCGVAVRACGPGATAPGAVWSATAASRASRDTVVAVATRLTRPLGHDERIDLNKASAAELARLPRVGPALAARIVAVRDTAGGFASLDALGRVPGIGPGTLAGLAPHVTLGVRGRRATGSAPPGRVAINRATLAELDALPGIGPALAAAIVADRAARGPYRTPDDLSRIRGVGPVLIERLRGRILLP